MTACSNPCGCDNEAIKRVWFAGCADGCDGHPVCARHATAQLRGIVRVVNL
jgi:hypothetical protein